MSQGSTFANKIRVGRRIFCVQAGTSQDALRSNVETAKKIDMWALATRGMHTAGQQTARALPSLLSRFKRDRTALRHTFKRCASQMVSQSWARNRGAQAARVTSLPPAQRSAKEQPDGVPPKRSKFPTMATTSETYAESKSRSVRRVRCAGGLEKIRLAFLSQPPKARVCSKYQFASSCC